MYKTLYTKHINNFFTFLYTFTFKTETIYIMNKLHQTHGQYSRSYQKNFFHNPPFYIPRYINLKT